MLPGSTGNVYRGRFRSLLILRAIDSIRSLTRKEGQKLKLQLIISSYVTPPIVEKPTIRMAQAVRLVSIIISSKQSCRPLVQLCLYDSRAPVCEGGDK